MSHASTVSLKIDNLECLKRACTQLNLKFMENQHSYIMYFGPKPCEHAIKVPGAQYEVGLTKTEDGKFQLVADFYSSGGLPKTIGNNASKIVQYYTAERVKLELRKKSGKVSFRGQKMIGETLQMELIEY